MKSYNTAKWAFYVLSVGISIVLILIYGSNGSHTPPFYFISAIVSFGIGGCWLILDWFLSMIYNDREFNLKIHLMGLSMNFLIMVGSIFTLF